MKKYLPTIIFILILVVIIFYDSFRWGFIWSFFLLDFVPTPMYVYDTNFLQLSIFQNIYNFLVYIFGYVFISNFYIYGIVWLTIYTWCSLWCYFVQKFDVIDDFQKNIIYIASISILIINPFFAQRMLTQPWVWSGILLLWIWRYILLKKFDYEISRKDIIYVWLLWWFSANLMNHALFMIILLATAYILATKFKKILQVIYIGIIVWLLNINWIIWWFLWKNEIIQWATTFSQDNIKVFATQTVGKLPIELSTALGYGFWAEKWQRLKLVQNANPLWYIFGLGILSIWILGIYLEARNKKSQNISIIYMCIWLLVITLWLWIGISNNIWSDAIQRIYEHIPGYRGLREPHKWIWVYIIILIPFVINWFVYITRKIDPILVLSLFIFLLYGRSPGIINMSGLYKLTDYPADYQNSRSYILSKYPDYKFVLLPWHSYMSCNWTSNVISITARDFYLPSTVKVADNIEIGSLYTNNNNPLSTKIEKYINNWQDNNIIKTLWYDGFIMRKWCSNTWSFWRVNDKSKFENIYSWNDVGIYIVK